LNTSAYYPIKSSLSLCSGVVIFLCSYFTLGSHMNILSIQSHVVFGHAGNSAAVFPMQCMGANVWPIHTVQFSNHTQYGHWAGMVMPEAQISELTAGIALTGQLAQCNAVLSGYIGSAAQGKHILAALQMVRAANPLAIYHCDPVMGHPLKGCIVAPGVAEFLIEKAILEANIVSPNQLELEMIVGRSLSSLSEIVTACHEVLARGPQTILIKHLHYQSKDPASFEMLALSNDEAWLIRRPILAFDKEPVGVGDMTSALFLASLLAGKSISAALEHTTAAVYGVLLETASQSRYELAVVDARQEYTKPSHTLHAIRL
jgi:pyridoxine kinase